MPYKVKLKLKRRRSAGFTLIELLVAITILAIVAVLKEQNRQTTKR